MANRKRNIRVSDRRRDDVALVMRVLSGTSSDASAAAASAHPDQARALWEDCAEWLSLPEVRGLAIGTRSRMGRSSSEVVLKVLVERKLPLDEVAAEIPGRLRVPGTRRSIPTDVEGIGHGGIDADSRFSVHLRPAPPGAPIRLRRQAPGTFACLVRDRNDADRLFLLSNSHVIAAHGRARRGQNVYQPSTTERFRPAAIGQLSYHIPVETSEHGYPNLADAAIAEVGEGLVRAEVYKVERLRGVGSRPADNDAIAKFGPASGFRTGTVLSAHANVEVTWIDAAGRGTRAGFADTVRCTRYAIPGDSGAAVVNSSRRLIGLHFASFEFESYFIPIRNVMAEFSRVHGIELELVTGL